MCCWRAQSLSFTSIAYHPMHPFVRLCHGISEQLTNPAARATTDGDKVTTPMPRRTSAARDALSGALRQVARINSTSISTDEMTGIPGLSLN